MTNEFNFSGITTPESLEVVQALQAQLPMFLEEDEIVLTAMPATWREPSDANGPGTYQGALIGTDRSLHFYFNPQVHSQFTDLTSVITNSRSRIVAARKVRTTAIVAGMRISVPGITHHLAIAFSDSEIVEFYITYDRFKEALRYFHNKKLK